MWVCVALVTCLTTLRSSAQFTGGNVVVLRVGDGTVALGTAARDVFLDEYTPGGVLVQSVPMPIAVSGSNKMFTLAGTQVLIGTLTRSPDGQYLAAVGYNAAPGTTGTTLGGSGTTRTVATIDYNETINTTRSYNTAVVGSGTPYSAVTNGTDVWFTSGNGGVHHCVSDVATTQVHFSAAAAERILAISNGQLYVSRPASNIYTVGSGLPTTGGQTATALPGIPSSAASGQQQYFFADLDAGVAGPDVVYVANDGALALQKYSLVSGTWVSNGTIGVDADDYRNIDGVVNGSSVTLYMIRKGTNNTAGSGELVSLTDASGYNGAFSGTPALLVTAANQTTFRGVAMAPVSSSCTAPSISNGPSSQSICPSASAILTVTASGSATLNYQWYQGNSGDETTPVGTNSNSYTTPPLTVATSYWVKVTNGCGFANSGTATIGIHSSATWTGSVNNDFNVAGNWNIGCVPTAGMNIIIPSGSPALTGATATVNSITISNGASLHLNDGASMNVNGDCVNDGTIVSGGTPDDGKLVFSGTSAQNISGTGIFSNIEISNTIDVFVISTITAKNVITLTGSKLTANTGVTINIIP